MTRSRRFGLSIMASFIFAELYVCGCSGAQQVTPDEGVQLSVLGVETACQRCTPGACRDASVLKVCSAWGGQSFVAAPAAGMGGVGGQ